MLPDQLSVVSPVVVGREAPLEALDRVVDQVAGGRGQVVVLSGEAGIGKSRLVGEIEARVRDRRWTILRGRSFEIDRALPFGPVVDLLREFCATHSPDEVATTVGSSSPELAKLVPELTRILPDAIPAEIREVSSEKHQIFEATTRFINQGTPPRLVVVEDLHWSDASSLEFMLYFVRRISLWPVLLLVTYRSDELTPELTPFLAELERTRSSLEINLSRLTRFHVGEMVRAIFDLRPPPRTEFVETLYTFTDGNPFFVEETLKAMLQSGDIYFRGGLWDRRPTSTLRVPRSIGDAVRSRIEHLTPPTRELVILAAVVGQRFDFPLLQYVTSTAEDRLIQQIKELVVAQLVAEVSADQFAFRHALTREAIYSSLLARERQTLHGQILDRLEQMYGASDQLEERVAELAYHASEAGHWEKALEYSQWAGERAQRLYAPREAVAYLSRALSAAQRLSLVSSALHRNRGLAYETIGDFEAADADFHSALAIAQQQADPFSEWQAWIDMGFLWASRDYARAGACFDRAFGLADQLSDRALVARSLNRVGNWHLNLEEPALARRHHEQALAIVRDLDDRHGVAETQDLLGIANYMCGDFVRGTLHYEAAATAFKELDDRQGLIHSLIHQTLQADFDTAVPAVPNLAVCLQLCREAVQLARAIGWRAGEAFGLVELGAGLCKAGEYGEALRALRTGIEIAEDIEHHEWLTVGQNYLGMLYVDLFALDHARSVLERAMALGESVRSPLLVRGVGRHLVSAYTLQGEYDRARATIAAALAPDDLAKTLAASEHTVLQRQILASAGELTLAHGEPTVALEIAGLLIGSAAKRDRDGQLRVIPRLWKLRGDALLRLGQADEAEGVLNLASDAARQEGRLPLVWRTHCTLGTLYLRQRRRDDAAQEFATATALVDQMADQIADATLREHFRRGAHRLIPSRPPETSRQAARRKYAGLTAREREVASLIARGLTNHEIAESLVVSDRTVTTHVTNMLAKLGFSSRTQIAAWAAEKGLSESALD